MKNDTIINIENMDLSEETITSISISEDYTVDIEVENEHHYILQNGIISHNTGIYANNISGGLEPLFLTEYIRTSIMPYAPEGLYIPKNIDWSNKTYLSDTNWEWIKEGDDPLLKTEFDGYIWKFDKSRGLLRETIVKDYSVRFLEKKNEWNSKAEYVATSANLNIDEHTNTMKVMAKYIDSAISKTFNIPNEYTFDDFKKLYMDLYNTGVIKGGTSYRDGTMASVLSSVNKTNSSNDDKFPKTNAPKRPKTLSCDIHHLTVSGDKWIVIIGLYEKEPYEVFAFKKKNINLSDKIKTGSLTKIKDGRYDLEFESFTLENIKEHFETTEQEALTRMISTALRHGADINFIYEQLQKSQGIIISFSKAVARTLKKYVDDAAFSAKDCASCGEKNSLIMQEGCYVCKNCSYSKCQ